MYALAVFALARLIPYPLSLIPHTQQVFIDNSRYVNYNKHRNYSI